MSAKLPLNIKLPFAKGGFDVGLQNQIPPAPLYKMMGITILSPLSYVVKEIGYPALHKEKILL